MTGYSFNFTGPAADYSLLGDRRYKGPVIADEHASGEHRASDKDRKARSRAKKCAGTHDQRCRNGRPAATEAA